MPTQLVDQDTFLRQLDALFKQSVEHGTVWLTHKRLKYDLVNAPDVPEYANEYPCLLRASNGKDIKFETRIEPGQLPRFHAAYGSLLKASMTTLRKRDKKREKQKAEELLKKKKRLTNPIPIEGPKRGNNRKKRQRRMKAAAKQENMRKKVEEREEAKKAQRA
ncbi:signal recognition particle SRP9/SRP14 subunit [Punctularia strigosozonata HHB-11173 SS5]|uniref:signal recognition particle SRP9/SRP14 subunit n=1 Tax=Punctularia strigosozonata (strain HHB-11173) TaxID=741275 RepID=UPI0004416F66|nr:signal recognition particle SRP9/SRP14 subunit [Punctularia strigosozonata HHB-11173 SS5]EIN14332.1 signal recognition particle SRP9/SRP14 subunit [Punctularia strigosozonata HHB-11173 SS5]